MLTGCSKKEEDFVLDTASSYEWSNTEETVPTILRDDELECESATETETEVETETETETRIGLSGIQLSEGGFLDMYEEPETEMSSTEQSDIVLESTPIVVDQATCSHVYEQSGNAKEPTCVKDGYTLYKCTICGKSKSEAIPATGHDYTEEVIAPTCTTQGYTLQKCSKCGSASKSNFTALMRHKEEHITIQEPQCIVEGIDEIRCADCNQLLRYENVKVLGHDWEVVKEDKPCVAGAVIKWKCKRCGLDRTEKLKGTHVFEAWKVETPATCKATGKQTRTCSVCSYKEEQTIAKLEHDLADWKIDKKATCSSAGERSRTCKLCNEKIETEEIPRTEHKPSEWKVEEKATCTEFGKKTKTCTICDQIVEKDNTPKLPHTLAEWKVEKKATCTEKGEQTRTCTMCEKVIEKEEIPKIAHVSNGDWEVTREATCTSTGIEKSTCAVCGQTAETRVLAKLDHFYTWVVKTEPTCTAEGIEVQQCSKCSGEINERTIPALGHTYVLSDITEPQCELAGLKTFKCTRCDDSYTEEISALGHTYNSADECIRCGAAKPAA